MPVSSELIERAARAMCAYDVRDTADPERRAVIEWDNESGYYLGFARAALEAALSLPQGAPEWQPIETCPCKKNATYLGFNKGGYFIFYASENKGERRFYLDEPDGIYRRTPTHWKPLGAPPASPDPEGL